MFSFANAYGIYDRMGNSIGAVQQVNISGGAGFVVPVCGEMTLMPGLAKVPAAVHMDIDKNGRITGLK